MADTSDLARMRREYELANGFGERDAAADWATQFGRWFADAVAARLPEPNAMSLATADPQGRPSCRVVLLKEYDGGGFTFYTNYESRKGVELSHNPYASLVFPWFAMHRQVVVCGSVERVDQTRAQAYFAVRPREAQLGAWASTQSQVLPDRVTLEEAMAAAERRFAGVDMVPMPPYWGGLRVIPETVEFWQGRAGRLHDRLRYRCTGEGYWILERLAP